MNKKVNQKIITQQYQNPSNFSVRRNLHERFGTNKYGWYKWVFDHFNFPLNSKILELGCGLGVLWFENSERITKNWDITLSDFSQSMLDKTKQNLEKINHPFHFQVMNIQNIPYPDDTFDVVIANGLLYLVSNLKKALREVVRVIKPGGILIASTSGGNYMKELEDLLEKSNLPVHRGYNKYSFSLDNGKDLLSQHFSQVELFRNENILIVTEAEPLVVHILSTNENLNKKQIASVRSYLNEYFSKHNQLRITIDTGMFIARK
ncbi:class I SAM-dependent methyltransferase [Candidatus Woesearchaeota archaeon]|nr:class I SAM-dependent methyltransferase [Candidatus Woesearchaeota archaeon]